MKTMKPLDIERSAAASKFRRDRRRLLDALQIMEDRAAEDRLYRELFDEVRVELPLVDYSNGHIWAGHDFVLATGNGAGMLLRQVMNGATERKEDDED